MFKFGEFEPINSFDIGIDPNFLAVASLDSTVRMMDITDGLVVSEYKGGHTASQYHGSVKLSKDSNKYVIIGSECGSVTLYDTSSKKLATSKVLHKQPVISVDVTSENTIASGSADGQIKIIKYQDDLPPQNNL